MPLFEFSCRGCGHRFERVVLGSSVPACPECSSRRVAKLLSAFAVGSSSGRAKASPESPAGCGSCGDPRGPGSCARN